MSKLVRDGNFLLTRKDFNLIKNLPLVIKLTDYDGTTGMYSWGCKRAEMEWGEGVTHSVEEDGLIYTMDFHLPKFRHHVLDVGEPLCTRAWIHCYESPIQAAYYNHCAYTRWWLATFDGAVSYHYDKMGVKQLTTLFEIEPMLTSGEIPTWMPFDQAEQLPYTIQRKLAK